MSLRSTPRALALVSLLTCASCLSSLGGEPQDIRYFAASALFDGPPANDAPGVVLRLRSVDASAHLRERITWRSSRYEYGFYELRRWVELPAAWLERGLATELFERRGATRTQALATPALDATLLAFEEVMLPEHVMNVAVQVTLVDLEGRALLHRTFEHSRPIGEGDPEGASETASRALGLVIAEAAQAVIEALGS